MKKLFAFFVATMFSFAAFAASFGIMVNGTPVIGEENPMPADPSIIEVFVLNQSLTAGQTVAIYDASSGATWAVPLDPASVAGIEMVDGRSYIVTADGCYDFYIKLEFENDQLYVGAGTGCGTTPTPGDDKIWYIYGYIGGFEYNGEDYPFVNGVADISSITTDPLTPSYVFVHEYNSGFDYMTNGWQGEVPSVIMYEVSTIQSGHDKLILPTGAQNLYIAENADGSVTVSLYPITNNDDPAVGDQFEDATSGLKFVITAVGEMNTVKVTANSYSGITYTIPAIVTYNSVDFAVTEIGEGAFNGCTSLESVTFFGNACQDAIGDNAFAGVGATTPAALTLPANWTGSLPDEEGNWYGGKFELVSGPAECKYTEYENWQIKPEGSEWSGNMEKVEDGLFKLVDVNWTGSGFNIKSDENPIKKDWFALEELTVGEEVIAPVIVDIYLRVIDDKTVAIGVGVDPTISTDVINIINAEDTPKGAIIKGGKVYIIRDGKVYNLQGSEIKNADEILKSGNF